MKTLISQKQLSGIDTLIYTSKKADRLMFLQHGIHSKKENVMQLLGVSFVKLGYTVVAIDAYKHGVRIEEPFLSKDEDRCELETMIVVKRTADDIVNLHKAHFYDTYSRFDIVGISMGGLIAHYLSTTTESIDTLVALISSPKFMAAAEHTFPDERQKRYPKETQAARNRIESMDPSTQPHRMHFKRMIMMNGLSDAVIPYTQSASFQLENPDKNILFKHYDTDHKISPKMHEDLLDLLRK